MLFAGLIVLLGANARAEVTPEQRAEVERAIEYLEGIRTLRARFIQVGPDGGLAQGTLYLKRPGRLRFEYDPPVPILIVGDGIWLVLVDKELPHLDRFPISQTPLGVLVAEDIELGRSAEVSAVDNRAGVLRMTLIDPDKPEEGALTLVFADSPLALKQWQVRDAQGGVTNVSLSEVETGMELKPDLFVFTDGDLNQYR